MNHDDSFYWPSECKRIPSLPHEAHVLIKALTQEEFDIRNLAEIIGQHPAISGRLIALANSAWVAPVNPIATVEQACVRLGYGVVRSVSIGLAVMSTFNINSCPIFDIHRYWVSCMLVADGAALLADAMPNARQQDDLAQMARTAGILHNLGMLCLAHLKPVETAKILHRILENPELDILEVSRQIIHSDYCEVGGLVAERWGIPLALVMPIKNHRDFNYEGQYWELSRLVGCAVLMVDAVFSGFDSPPDLFSRLDLPLDPVCMDKVYSNLKGKLDEAMKVSQSLFN